MSQTTNIDNAQDQKSAENASSEAGKAYMKHLHDRSLSAGEKIFDPPVDAGCRDRWRSWARVPPNPAPGTKPIADVRTPTNPIPARAQGPALPGIATTFRHVRHREWQCPPGSACGTDTRRLKTQPWIHVQMFSSAGPRATHPGSRTQPAQRSHMFLDLVVKGNAFGQQGSCRVTITTPFPVQRLRFRRSPGIQLR